MSININILSNFNGAGFDRLQKELNRLTTPMEKVAAVSRAMAPAAQIGLLALGGMAVGAVRAAEEAGVADNRLQNVAESMGLFGSQTDTVVKRLQDFVANPGIEMGSDVKGAVEASLRNLATAKAENPSARLTLVIASDMVDEVSLTLPRRLAGLDSNGVCNVAVQDAGNASNDNSSVNVVIVGARNSKVNTKTLDQVQSYWTCYLNQIGITNVTEQSDLSGF
jgi:hypothetical protein